MGLERDVTTRGTFGSFHETSPSHQSMASVGMMRIDLWHIPPGYGDDPLYEATGLVAFAAGVLRLEAVVGAMCGAS